MKFYYWYQLKDLPCYNLTLDIEYKAGNYISYWGFTYNNGKFSTTHSLNAPTQLKAYNEMYIEVELHDFDREIIREIFKIF